MPRFTPCRGNHSCNLYNHRCVSCERHHEEIIWLGNIIDQLAGLADEYGYDNIDEYARYVADRVTMTIRRRRNGALA